MVGWLVGWFLCGGQWVQDVDQLVHPLVWFAPESGRKGKGWVGGFKVVTPSLERLNECVIDGTMERWNDGTMLVDGPVCCVLAESGL